MNINLTIDGEDVYLQLDENQRGYGIALKLVNKTADYARAEHKKIILQCSYAKKVLTGNRDYEDVLYNATNF